MALEGSLGMGRGPPDCPPPQGSQEEDRGRPGDSCSKDDHGWGRPCSGALRDNSGSLLAQHSGGYLLQDSYQFL